MTVSSTNRRAGPFNGNGSQTAFPFAFKVFSKDDLLVVTADADGLETTLVLDSDYSVALNADQDANPGGTITYPISGTALPVGETLTATTDVDNLQPTDIINAGGFYPQVIEDAFDRSTIQVQQVSDKVDRALQLALSTPDNVSTQLPVPVANMVIGWDDSGTGLRNVDPTTLATVVAFAAWQSQTFDGDGTTLAFTLSSDPGNINNLDIAIGGVTQTPLLDFTLSGTTLTFTSAPPAGTDNIFVRWGQALPQGTTTSGLVTHLAPDIGAVDQQLDDILTQEVNAASFGFVPTGTAAGNYTAIVAAVKAAMVRRAVTLADSIAVFIPDGGYQVAGWFPLVTGIRYRCNARHSAKIFTSGNTASGATATYALGVFTDNLNATVGQVQDGSKAVENAGIDGVYFEQIGTISGNAPSGTPWQATLQIVGAPAIVLNDVGAENKTNNKDGISLKYCWRYKLNNPWVPRGGAYSGGYGILTDSQCNAGEMRTPFAFGAWAEGISLQGCESTTVIEPNVEFAAIGLRTVGGSQIRVVGGYYEGNTKEVVIGTGGSATDGWTLERPWFNGSGATHAVEVVAGIHGEVYRPRFTGTYSVSKFLMTGASSANYSNDFHVNVGDASTATTAGLAALGLTGAGRNRIHCYGEDGSDHRLMQSFDSDGNPLEMQLNQRGAKFNCFELFLKNDGGTLKVAVTDGQENGTVYDDCFVAVSSALVAQSDVSAVAGFGVNVPASRLSGSNSVLVLNTSDNVLNEQSFICGAVRTNNGVALTAHAQLQSRDINGTMRIRPEIILRRADTDAAFDFDTVNFTAGEYVKVPVIGFIR